jgi:predicted ATPase
MTRSIFTVRNGTLHEHTEETSSTDTIAVESTTWYVWLENHHSFRFEHPAHPFTARKEQRSGGWYWYAYRRQAGRLHTAYLGRSAELSVTRLNVIAAILAGVDEKAARQAATATNAPNAHASNSSQLANVTELEPVLQYILPRPLTSLVGREQEVAAAGALLQGPEVRLLSMVGTAGVGKTRLALQVATDLVERFADGVFFVALAPVRDTELVLSTVAQTLGLRAMGSQSFLDLLKRSLRDKHCLLLLDNFEHVVGAAPRLSDLLEACPDLKVLVTSREVLRLRAEHQFSVPPLALPDRKRLPDHRALAHVPAVDLFIQRAQAIRPDFQLTPGNAAAIAEICIRLDGLPLAIELAAARSKSFPPQTLLTRLEQGLAILSGGARDLPARQQTLHGTLAWSYDLLSPEEQALFRRFAVFVDGCTWEAAEQVCTAAGELTGDVLEGLASLVDKSLLRQEEQGEGEPRFAMLQVLREFG